MRSALSFFSLVAFAILVAGVLSVVLSGSSNPSLVSEFSLERIDLGSLLIGIVIGCVLSVMARVSWSELPRRCAHWLLANEGAFYRFAAAGVLVAVLVYY